MGKVFKNPKFLIGFSFVAMLFLVSVFYGIFFGDRIPKMEIFINDNGDPVRPVYSPIEYPPFGTNTHGEPMLNVILVGAKYTIAFALIITILRFVFSASIGVLLETYFPKVMKLFSKPVDAFHYFPLTLLSYFLLEWVLFSDRLMDGTFTYSFADRVLIETIVLVVVALPITTQLIASETRLIYHREFMEGAKVIGGSRWHILKKTCASIFGSAVFHHFCHGVDTGTFIDGASRCSWNLPGRRYVTAGLIFWR